MNIYEEDLALNNLQWLICHKTKPNQGRGTVVLPFAVRDNGVYTFKV